MSAAASPSSPTSLERRAFLQRMALAAGGASLVGTAACSAGESAPSVASGADAPPFELYYDVYADGPAVVFAHGAGGTHMSWWQQIPAFSQLHRCVIYDQRSFGYSADVGGPGRAAFVEDLRGMLDDLGIQKASLVGQSMGGRSVLGFAAAYPERVEALVMASTTGGYTDPELEEVRAAAPNLGTRSAFAASFPQREPEKAFLYRLISKNNQRLTPGAEDATTETPVPDIQRIMDAEVPTLFTLGEQDTVAVPNVIEAMSKKMGAKLVKFPESGHSTYWELPDEFNSVVMEFIEGARMA